MNPATVNNDAATNKNNLDVVENSGVFRMPNAWRTANKNPATRNKVGQSGLTLIGMECPQMDAVFRGTKAFSVRTEPFSREPKLAAKTLNLTALMSSKEYPIPLILRCCLPSVIEVDRQSTAG